MTHESQAFDAAMDAILKADPAKVKAQMESEKKDREAKRKGKASDDKDG